MNLLSDNMIYNILSLRVIKEKAYSTILNDLMKNMSYILHLFITFHYREFAFSHSLLTSCLRLEEIVSEGETRQGEQTEMEVV